MCSGIKGVRIILTAVILAMVFFASNLHAAPKKVKDKSDLNGDGIVDILDVEIFSTNYLEMAVFQVDWCLFYESTIAGLDFEGEPTDYYLRYFKELLAFIYNYEEFGCQAGPFLLELENQPKYPARIERATNGDYLISDPVVGSVFYYNSAMEPQLELKGLSKPLGLALDAVGNILVGNHGAGNVEVYKAADGNLVNVFGADRIRMPTALAIGPDGEVFVTDSKSHQVWVFDADYQYQRSIGRRGDGPGGLKFPTDSEIISWQVDGNWFHEIFVADQGHNRVQVYGLDGTWLRTLTFEGTEGTNCNWAGVCETPGLLPFTRLQGLDTDDQGRLHVLDVFSASVMIFDPADGTFIETYGEHGEGEGMLRLPIDVLIDGSHAVISAGEDERIEVIAIP